jgi:type II secretory pathway component PulF
MVRAGEVSGSLQSLLDHLAGHYEEEGRLRMGKFTTVVTLAVILISLIIIASTIVGFYIGYAGQFKSLLE